MRRDLAAKPRLSLWRLRVGRVVAVAPLALVVACSSATGAGGGATPPGVHADAATTAPSVSTTPTPRSSVTAHGPLSVSIPVPATAGPGTASVGGPQPSPARPGRNGPTQRHPFAPTSIELDVRDGQAARAPVETIDTSVSGELALPADPGTVGWWQSGALAGDAFGTVVVAGHIDSRDRGVGFFIRLLRVQPGDTVVLSNGVLRQGYRVVSTKNVPKASLATGTDTFAQNVPARLVLLTCTGPFDPVTHYPDNLVVTAEPIGDAAAG